jgi:predicted ATPase
VQYREQAALKALRRSANREAIDHLTRGLDLLRALPDTPERTQHELTLQIALGVSLTATKSYAAPEVEKTYARALALCQQVEETTQHFPVLWGLWGFHDVRAELQTARELAEQLLRLAQSSQDPALLLEAHNVLGNTLLHLGELTLARTHLEQGIALYDPLQHSSHAFLCGQDPGVACRSYAALTLWCLGYPDQALQRSHEALTLAQELSHAHSSAWAFLFTIGVLQLRREGDMTQEQAEALITLSTEHGLLPFLAFGTIL